MPADRSRPSPHARLPSGKSTPTIARLLRLASVLGPLIAAYRLRDLPWKLDEEQNYSYDTLLNPPWEDVFLDAWAALCSLHPHGSSVCASLQVHTATAHELLIATPVTLPPSCKRWLSAASESSHVCHRLVLTTQSPGYKSPAAKSSSSRPHTRRVMPRTGIWLNARVRLRCRSSIK